MPGQSTAPIVPETRALSFAPASQARTAVPEGSARYSRRIPLKPGIAKFDWRTTSSDVAYRWAGSFTVYGGPATAANS